MHNHFKAALDAEHSDRLGEHPTDGSDDYDSVSKGISIVGCDSSKYPKTSGWHDRLSHRQKKKKADLNTTAQTRDVKILIPSATVNI